MPNDTQIVGYARSKISVDEIRQKCQPFLKVSLVFILKKDSTHSAHRAHDEPDLNKSQKARPKTPTASKVIPYVGV